MMRLWLARMQAMDPRDVSYRFADVEVDPRSHRVTRNGTEVALEPKAFALLLQLLQHPGELLERRRLLDAVWGHSAVTPATLNRIIALLRKALGDDIDSPRYIETVHGLGYRFVGAVQATTSDAAKHGDSAATVVAAALPKPRATGTIAGIAIALVLLAALCFALLRPRPANTALSATLVVLPFDSSHQDAELGAAADGFSESLMEALSRIPGLRVIGRESAFALDRGADAESARTSLGVDYAISGSVLPQGADVEMSYSLWRRGVAAPLWLQTQRVPRTQIFRVLLPLSERVRTSLAPTSTAPNPLAISVTAQDLYWLGRHYLHERTPQGLVRALGYFEQAADEDAHFALAYCGLADSYMLLTEYGNVDIDEASTKARAALMHAQALDPQSADVLASEGLILLDEYRFDEATVVLHRALQRAPQHLDALLWYGNALAYSGRVREAAQWHAKAAELDPLNAVLKTYQGIDHMLAGDQVRAGLEFERALALNPDYAEAYWQSALQREFHGQLTQAAETYRAAERHHAATGWTDFYLADAYLRAGNLALADKTAGATSALPAVERLESFVWLALLDGRAAKAMTALEAFHAQPLSLDRITALRARTLAALGRDAEARDLYEELFSPQIERGDTLVRLWSPDLNLMHFSNWLSLSEPAAREPGLRALSGQLDRFADGGMNLPVLQYQRAVMAALRGDAAAADERLTGAQNAGWLDACAFERDLVWRAFESTPWLKTQRKRLALRASSERAGIDPSLGSTGGEACLRTAAS